MPIQSGGAFSLSDKQLHKKQRQRAYYIANKEKWKEYGEKWRKANPEKHEEIQKKSRAKNIEKRRALFKKWREANKEYVKKRCAEWRAKNPDHKERYRETTMRCSRRWALANPDARTAHACARRARVRNRLSSDANRAIIRSFYTIARRVTRCIGVEHHVDHIIPIFRGGMHHESNLQILPAKINLSKGSKLI